MTSMLAAVARAAGLAEETEPRRLNVVDLSTPLPSATAPHPLAVAIVKAAAAQNVLKSAQPALRTATTKVQPALRVTPEATAYIANLEAHGHKLKLRERNDIARYCMTWASSAEIREEFNNNFRTFAAYMRGKAKGIFK